MSKLHLANSTTQTIVFFYRDPVTKLLHNVEIGSGKQQVIVGAKDNWTRAHIDQIIKQAEQGFGARDAAEVHRTMKKFHGLLYRVDGIIAAEEITVGNGYVKRMQNDRSVEQAVSAAVAADVAANPEKGQRRTKKTLVEVEQLPQPGERPTGNETRFSLEVDPENGSTKRVTESVAA